MRFSLFLAVVAVLALGWTACPPQVSAAVAPVVVDEWGNGSWDGLRLTPAMVSPDPSGDQTPANLGWQFLVYRLPFAVVPGDVVLTEPEPPWGDYEGWSDVLRFIADPTGANNQSLLIFYSDNVGGYDEPADTSSPPALLPNRVFLPEDGPEGRNGLFYVPLPNEPGFAPDVASYTFISDGRIPEPCTLIVWSLLGASGIGIGWLRRKRAG